MKKIELYIATAVLLLTACERRPLEEDYVDTALIPVCIEWMRSGVPADEMHRASIWLFPKDNGQPLEYRMENDLNYREIQVPTGIYSVLVFNETIDREDWNNITFTGTNRYETFAAMENIEQTCGFYNYSEDLPLMKNPEPLAAWSLDHFEVTPEMVIRTGNIARRYNTGASRREALVREVPDLTNAIPLPRFERVIITAYVQNLSGSMQVTGIIDSMLSGVYMASGEKIPTHAAHAFLLKGRLYDSENSDNGTVTCSFNIFGRLAEERTQHRFVTDFILTDGTLHSQEMLLQNNSIITRPEGIVKMHIINTNHNLPYAGERTDVTVDNWDEIIIPIQ